MTAGDGVGRTASIPADEQATRGAGRRSKRRAEFVDAALRAIADYGPQVSTEQVADHVGVSRTKFYRYFDDAADLHRSVARRASEMLSAKHIQTWTTTVRPVDMITDTVSAHLRWRIENPSVYEYLSRRSLSDEACGAAAIEDVNTTAAVHLAGVIGALLRTFGLDERPALALSFGMVGLVESATTRWLNDPRPVPLPEITQQLFEWMWALWNTSLRSGGIYLDPHQSTAVQYPQLSSG